MNLQLIRNATLILHYAGKRFLVDPFLAEKHRYPAFPNAHSEERNPTVDLPLPVEAILSDIDAVIVTHTHIDHWDEVAIELLPKDLPILALSQAIASEITGQGFTDVRVIIEDTFEGVSLTRTSGHHGHGEFGHSLGEVWGIIFRHPNEKTLYIAGDTIFCPEVEGVLTEVTPDVVVVNGGANQLLQGGPIVMDMADIFQTHQTLPTATIISVHMEAANHAFLSRAELRNAINEQGLTQSILVPNDGETLEF